MTKWTPEQDGKLREVCNKIALLQHELVELLPTDVDVEKAFMQGNEAMIALCKAMIAYNNRIGEAH